jgi:hypothetical protein
MHFRTVYERLVARGVNVPGKNPANNVNAHMSTDPRIENVDRGMWGLKSWRRESPRSAAPDPFGDDVSIMNDDEAPTIDPHRMASRDWLVKSMAG